VTSEKRKEEQKGVGGCPGFGPPLSPKLEPREKLPLKAQSTAYYVNHVW